MWKMLLGSLLTGIMTFADGDGGAGGNGGAGGTGEGDKGGSGEGDKGKTGDDWRSGLDPEIKDHACLKDFKTKDDVVKAYVGAQKLIGVDKLPIPPEDAKPEVKETFMNEVFDRLGRPKEAKDYHVELPEGVKIDVSDKEIEALKAEAHKLGLLPQQLNGIYQWHMTNVANRMKAYQAELETARKDTEAKLRSEWGAAYEGKVAKAQKLLNAFAGDDYKQLLDSGFGNNPAVIKFMADMADKISEDAFAKGTAEATMTPEEAQKELSIVRKKILEMPQTDPEYKELLKRRNDLMEMAHPS